LRPLKKLENPKKIKSIYNSIENKFNIEGLSFKELDDRRYVVTILSGWKRCSWCESFRKLLSKEVKIINEGYCSNFTKAKKY